MGLPPTVRRRAAIRRALVRPHPKERACGRGAANPGERARVSKGEEGSCKLGLRLFPVFVLLAPVMDCNPADPRGAGRAHFLWSSWSLRESPPAPGCARPPVFLLSFTGKNRGTERVEPRARSLIAAGRLAMLAAVQGDNGEGEGPRDARAHPRTHQDHAA